MNNAMRRLFSRILIAVVSFHAFSTLAATGEDPALTFRLPALPEIKRHLFLLENPSFLVLVLENNGMGLSLSTKPVIRGRTNFEIRNLAVRYDGKSGAVYRYVATLKLSLAGVATEVTVPAEVDVSGLGEGSITIKARPPMAGVIPAALLDRVNFKLRLIADLSRQRELLKYLDGLPQAAGGSGVDPRFEAILTEAYNRGTVMIVPARDNGEAIPLSEQLALIVTIAIWLVAAPLAMFLRYRRNLRRRPAQGGDEPRR
jgi:hypothetical protein